MSKDINLYSLGTFSLAAGFTSPPTVVKKGDNFSYQIDVTTSDSIGNFYVEASNTYDPQAPANINPVSGTWVRLNLSGQPFANAANDSIGIDLNQPTYNAFHLVYVPSTAGTGTCKITVLSKQLGA